MIEDEAKALIVPAYEDSKVSGNSEVLTSLELLVWVSGGLDAALSF